MPTQDDFPELADELNGLEIEGDASEAGSVPLKLEEEAHIFENYSFEHSYSPDLPITNFHKEVIETIESNSVTIIQGMLGSSKLK